MPRRSIRPTPCPLPTVAPRCRRGYRTNNPGAAVSKRTPTKDVFDRLDELDDPAAPGAVDSEPEAVTATAKSGADDEMAEGTGEDNQTGAHWSRRRVLAVLLGAVVIVA